MQPMTGNDNDKGKQFGVTPQSQDFNEWYNEVVVKADLADYSPVKGAMVVKPYGSALWERVVRWLDDRFKETGHESLLFPTLIPMNFIAREADHVDFSVRPFAAGGVDQGRGQQYIANLPGRNHQYLFHRNLQAIRYRCYAAIAGCVPNCSACKRA